MTTQRLFFLAMVPILSAGPAVGVVVDHDDIDWVASAPQSIMDIIGQQKWFFTHASVGSNMIAGISDLHAAAPTRYLLVSASVGYNSTLQRANNPPSPTVNGRIYECSRGNPGWQSKFIIFSNSVKDAGWHDTAVTAAMDKLCYIDQAANATTYLNTMLDLEATYPHTVFVYATMPLTTGTDSNNVLRNQYNTAVRTFCLNNQKLLYDIADMEAHDPAGNPSTFTYGDQTYQKLYSGYTNDGGHLNTVGRQRIAIGWYAVAAFIAARNAPGDLDGDGRVNQDDFALFTACISGSNLPHGGSTTCQKADADNDNDVDQSDFGVFQRCISGDAPADPSCAD